MKERPILFSSSMVRAILAGTKTQTRRIVKDEPAIVDGGKPYRPQRYAREPYIIGGVFGRTPHTPIRCPYGEPGDRVWVRETFARDVPGCEAQGGVSYRADHNDPRGDGPANPMRWTPAIHMPRALSRIDLEVTAVRVERLQAITEEDARAEGVEPFFTRFSRIGRDQRITSGELATDAEHRASFAVLWDEINGDRAPWASNPWIWVVSFKRTRP